MADKPSTELATFDPSQSAFPVLFGSDDTGGVAQIIEDNFGDEGFSPSDLDRLTVPSGGGKYWDIPDEPPAEAIEGVVIHRQATRSFWVKKRGEDGEDDGPPDCYSSDGKVGLGLFGKGSDVNPQGACAECPMNQFGSSTSGSGEGKACKEQMQLFLLTEGAVLPTQLTLPPTSLRPWRKYMTRLAAKGKSYYAVVTRIALEVTKGGGQTYSIVNPSKLADLEPAEVAAAREYGATIKAVIDQSAANRDAMVAAEAASGADEGAKG